MLLFWKLLAQILAGISGFVGLFLGLKPIDKRTKKYKYLRSATFVIFFLSLFSSIILTTGDHYDNINEVNNLNKNYERINDNLDSVKFNYDSIKSNYDTIRIWQTRLNEQLTPFLILATKKYPKINQDSALKRLYESMIVKGDLVISNNQSGGVTGHTIAPNALIFTEGQQGGNNTVVNPVVGIPEAEYAHNWIISNVKVNKIKDAKGLRKDSIKLPNEKYPYESLFHNQIQVKYYSKVRLDKIGFILKRNDVIFATIFHDFKTMSSMGKTKNEGHQVLFITEPLNGLYTIDYYTKEKINVFTEFSYINNL